MHGRDAHATSFALTTAARRAKPSPRFDPFFVRKGTLMPKQYSAPPAMTIDPSKSFTATFKTSKGTIVVDLFPDAAPNTVNNFVFLARDGF
jgi:hypothetical protein